MTGQDRYLQAIRKARLISSRSVRNLIAGKGCIAHCVMDLEQKFIIAEFDRLHARIDELQAVAK